MKFFSLFFLCAGLFVQTVQAQYQKAYDYALQFEKKQDFYKAIITYNAATVALDKPKDNDIAERIAYCANQLNQLRTEAINARIEAENAKEEMENSYELAKVALAHAKEMRQKMETAVLDRAIKDHYPEWKSFAKYANSDSTQNKILSQIDSLDLSDNALLHIPKEVARCINLKFLNLLGNPDIDWKDAEYTFLKQLKNDVDIYVSVEDLSEIDSNYWHFITGIEILPHESKFFPQNILQQKQLKYLKLVGIGFEKLPTEIGLLTNLTNLSLYRNKLECLPQGFVKLTNLTKLDLSENRLSILPPEIGNLTKLINLELYENSLNILPPEFGKLVNLTAVDLEDNQLSKLPVEIGNLTNLNMLYLEGNPLTTLPSEISEIPNLKELSLSVDSFRELANEIRKLKNVTILYLESKRLGTLPVEISKLTNLTELHLSMDSLSAFPPEISKLKNLSLLSLYGHKLKTLPIEIGSLSNLKELILITDSLSNLPPEIGKLSRLKRMKLDVGYLQSVPDELFALKLLYTNYFDIGRLLFKAKNYKQALKSNLRSIEINNTSANAGSFGNAGLCYRLLGDPGNALAYLNEYLSFNENNIWCLNQLSYTHAAMNNAAKAFEYAEKSNKIEINANVWAETGNQLLKVKNYEKAIESYLMSIDIDTTKTNITNYSNVGSCFGKLGLPQKALEYYTTAYSMTKKLILIDSNNYSNWYNLSFYCLFVGKITEGIEAALRSLDLAPDQKGVITNLALGYVLNNQYDKAEPIYLEWKNKKFPNDERFAKEVFLKDIQDLEDANITHPDFEKVRKLYQE